MSLMSVHGHMSGVIIEHIFLSSTNEWNDRIEKAENITVRVF